MTVRSVLSILFIAMASGLRSQDTTGYCIPTIDGQPRPKGLELTYERMLDYGITGTRNDVSPGDYATQVRRNARWKSKIRLPLLNTPAWKVNMGLGYSTENYSLEQESGSGDQVLSLLDDKQLRSISAGLYVVKPFVGNRYLVLRTNSSLNDDGTGTFASKQNSLKHEIALVYGIKRNASSSIGFGIAFGYTLGRASLLPVIGYDRSFNKHWGLEVLLPSYARARYAFGQGNLLLFGAKIDGANYNIRLQGQGLDGVYFLERSDLRAFMRYEREIHDWLWFGADVGLNTNLDLSLVTDHGAQRGEVILSNSVNNAFYFGAGFFVVPPKKMWQ